MDTPTPTTKTLTAKCFCGSVHFTLQVPTANLPVKSYLCHCSICRPATGAPAIFHAHRPKDSTWTWVAPSSEASLTKYRTPGQPGAWDFCSKCGCHTSCREDDGTGGVVSPSVFEDQADFVYDLHVFSKSAKDGGIFPMLTHIGGQELRDWNPHPDEESAKLVEYEPEFGPDGEERLRAQCRCGGVSFTIPRPTKEVLEDPYLKQYVSPLDKTKWLASFDLCDDCRLVTGTNLIGWTFIPLSLCDPPIKPDLLIGTSKTYESSPGTLRSFCGDCGATVFYSNEERKPSEEKQIVDLATGLLRPPEGPMAETWLTWRTRMAWEDSGMRFDGAFTEALKEGMRRYTLEKNGQILDMEIA